MHTKTVKHIPQSVQKIVIEKYGENYLEDADYVSFFWGNIGKDEIKKLFNVVDKALGKTANKLTDTDFKKIEVNSNEDDTMSSDVEDDIEDAEDVGNTADADEDIAINDDDKDNVQLDEDGEQMPVIKTNYFFLKITLK